MTNYTQEPNMLGLFIFGNLSDIFQSSRLSRDILHVFKSDFVLVARGTTVSVMEV